MSLAGQVFVVTGGAGAIAQPILAALKGAGAQTIAIDHHEHDLTKADGAIAMVKAIGRIDGLVHTVGGFTMGKVHEAPVADYDRMFDRNVRSLFYTVRAVLPQMLERKRGFLCGFSSTAGWTGEAPGTSLYAAAKSAVAAFLRSLDGELTGTGVRVAIVYPIGAVDTAANRRDMPSFDPARYIDPVEIADAIVFAATRGPRARLTELPIWPAR
jgi:NADP-dependent 3-hydroxy acid dehydrogenase YdfG